jgi:hypothetical protein
MMFIQSTRFSSHNLKNIEVLHRFSKYLQFINFIKTSHVAGELFHADRRTGMGRTELTKAVVAIGSFVE